MLLRTRDHDNYLMSTVSIDRHPEKGWYWPPETWPNRVNWIPETEEKTRRKQNVKKVKRIGRRQQKSK